MINKLYEFVTHLGYTHPLHPALTHLPIGGVMVAFFLTLAGLLFKKKSLLNSAYHAATVAIIFLIPTVAVGILDWQHYYAGAWLFPIEMKMGLATSLLVFLSVTLLFGSNSNAKPAVMMVLYTLCLLHVAGLGYFGGELVFGSRHTHVEQHYEAGQKLFSANCSGCHVNGGNVIRPELPLATSAKLQHYETFLAFIRDPKMPDGTKGVMPDFPLEKLSDQQAQDLYNYVVHKLAKPKATQN